MSVGRSRVGLSALLTAVNLGLVIAVLVVVVGQAGQLLRRLGDAQALGRVRLAGLSATRELDDTRHHLVTSARLLAERPTLVELARASDATRMREYLAQFQISSELSGCAVILENRTIWIGSGDLETAESESEVQAWLTGAAPSERAASEFFWQERADEAPRMGAVAPLPGYPGSIVVTTCLLDRSYLQTLEQRIGAAVTIVPRDRFDSDDRGDLRRRAIADGSDVLHRLDDDDAYLAIVPLPFAPTAGVFEVALSGAGVSAAMVELRRSLLILAVLVAAGAAAVSVFLGQRLVGPLRDLTVAAARIGRGDLETPIRRASGAEIGTLGTTMEDMRRRLVELTAELRRHRAEAETLLSGVLDGVFTVDRERRIRYVNPQAAALVGLQPPEILGRFCGDVLDPEPINGVRPCEDRCPILHARFRGTVRATEHLCLRRGNRQRTVVITSARPESDSEESTELVQFQMMRDETEVEATRRLRDLVVANITHEFRTPLAAQRASIELLHDRLADLPHYDQVQGLVESLELGTLRLTWLIDNLLESARLEAGRSSIRRQPVAIDQVVEEAVSVTASLFAQRAQTVESDLPFPLPMVVGDAARLVQVFVNVLANANKFAPPGTTIHVGGEVESAHLVLWVEDAGPGFPEHDRNLLFERFVRSPGEEPEAGGMGLGLWIVRSVVERHGGQVEASSGSRAGARVSIRLPLPVAPTSPDSPDGTLAASTSDAPSMPGIDAPA